MSDTRSALGWMKCPICASTVSVHVTVVTDGQRHSRVNELVCRTKTDVRAPRQEFVYHRFGMSVKKVAPAVNRDPAVRISCRVIGPADHRCGAATVLVSIGSDWGTEAVAIFRSVVRASMKTAVTKELLIPQKDHIGSAGRAGKLMGSGR